jgi:hypothetical protein
MVVVIELRIHLDPSLSMLSGTIHNPVPHASLTISYSAVPSPPTSLVKGVNNGISDIEAGVRARRFGTTLILENKGGVSGKGTRMAGDGVRHNNLLQSADAVSFVAAVEKAHSWFNGWIFFQT